MSTEAFSAWNSSLGSSRGNPCPTHLEQGGPVQQTQVMSQVYETIISPSSLCSSCPLGRPSVRPVRTQSPSMGWTLCGEPTSLTAFDVDCGLGHLVWGLKRGPLQFMAHGLKERMV